MPKKATHNSATCERPYWWDLISWLSIPFARTQSKTIQEQLNNGVRMFDLRIKEKFGQYHAAHGIYTTKRTFEDILAQLNKTSTQEDPIYVTITYEGKLSNQDDFEFFKIMILSYKYKYSNIKYGQVVVKYTNNDIKVDWVNIIDADNGWPKTLSKFKALDGSSWHTYLPIPWLWKKIYHNHTEFNEDYFIFVDFI